MYSDCVECSGFSGCTYYHVNNPNLGTFESNIGDVAPCDMTTCRLNGKQIIDNQKVVAAASQHSDTLIGEVQPHHQ